jgi:hypothetical protein
MSGRPVQAAEEAPAPKMSLEPAKPDKSNEDEFWKVAEPKASSLEAEAEDLSTHPSFFSH